ncbi:MAG: M3 family metallopeptidase [Wenzhouxiangellaceae bacterium]|nr:M3 family metallopeptidase [Wenzhouxiangellaceae bacterium]
MPHATDRTSPSDNPLLETGLPRFRTVRPEHALPAVEARLAEYRGVLEAIESGELPPEPETLLREVRADDGLALAWSTIGHLHAVVNSPQWREAYSACLKPITEFYTARGQNRAIFECWKAVAGRRDFAERPRAFRRMVEEEIIGFEHSGVHLDDEPRARFAQISLRLSELGNTFGNHVLDATEAFKRHFEDASELAGLPPSALETLRARAEADEDEGWTADLTYPCYQAIVTYAEDRELRRTFYEAHATRASSVGPNAGEFDNEPVVSEILHLREELAALLGFDTYAELVLSRRMAEAPDRATSFLRDLAERAGPAARQQLEALQRFAADHGAETPLEPWDLAFWTEKMREETLGLSEEKLKPYFELEAVLAALFGLAERLFGVSFERDDSVESWHEDVRFYRVRSDSGEPDAGVYIDLYARSGKQGGAWMDVCRQRMGVDGPVRAPVAYLTCNFAAPGRDRPSLLKHDDVVTLFHEFGHCLHHLLTRVDWPPVAGIAGVEWDAVELPSQLLEGWTWEGDFLREFARHHETDEPLPAEWIEALNEDRRFQGALALTRQLEFALTDLALHRGESDDPVATMRRIHDEVAVTPLPDFNRFLMSFGHLFDGGYAAGYYSYLWAERLARDAFSVFRERGLHDVESGRRLRDEILAVGASRPMQESWLAFRGREAALEPLLDVYGVAA